MGNNQIELSFKWRISSAVMVCYVWTIFPRDQLSDRGPWSRRGNELAIKEGLNGVNSEIAKK